MEIPIETLLVIVGRARFVPVIVDEHGNVIAEGSRVATPPALFDSFENPVALNRGREIRHANWKQRHAFIPTHHHDRIHNDGWMLELGPDRSLVIRKQGAVIMSTGPPAEQWAA